MGVCLACLRNSEESSVAGASGRVVEVRPGER